MKNYIRSSSKVLFGYLSSLIIFVVFLYIFLSFTKERFGDLLPYYSLFVFLLMILIIYNDQKSMAIKEKKPQYDLHPYPMKGLVYGLMGILPVALLVAIAALIKLDDPFAARIRELAINTILGPVFFLIKWMNESVPGYIVAILLIPLISTLGYLAGYYKIEIMSKIIKKKAPPEKGFTKSPWNPSNIPDKSAKKKKTGEKKTQKANSGQ